VSQDGHDETPSISDEERQLLLIVQEGIPLVPEPYAEIGRRLGIGEERVRTLLESLLAGRVIKRLAAVPNHYALGVTHNGMSVWDVPDDLTHDIGLRLGRRPEVTHCYRRPRRPGWPYNLFAMVHGMSRDEVLSKIESISEDLGLRAYAHEVLFSTRMLKKRGMRVLGDSPPVAVDD
jgi:DNA-binding Lrp family transcriptional regulator